jgi:hypothetical protein
MAIIGLGFLATPAHAVCEVLHTSKNDRAAAAAATSIGFTAPCQSLIFGHRRWPASLAILFRYR